jgi:FkbM family methyltransferase
MDTFCKRIVIFGTGSSGERAFASLQQLAAFAVVAFADNDPGKQSERRHERPVWSAAELITRGKDWDLVCIASQWHAEILHQLLALGVPGSRIGVCDPWGEGGLIAGIGRWGDVFPLRDPVTAAIPEGFLEDFARLGLLRSLGFAPRQVLDVGASNGQWSVACAHVFPEAAYALVEPLPESYLVQLTAPAAGWTRLPFALGASDGEITIAIPESVHGAAEATVAPGRRPCSGSRQVAMRQIDTLLAERTIELPDLVKLDVQGYESEVLAGAEKLWGATEVFFVELSLDQFWPGARVFHEMVALFAARGYMVFDFFHELRKPNGQLEQIDAVFLRCDGSVATAQKRWRTFRH